MINHDERAEVRTRFGTADASGVSMEMDQLRFERLWAAKGVPASLLKAVYDPFDYALGLRSGRVFHFEKAWLPEIDQFAGWVHLSGVKKGLHLERQDLDEMSLERGVDIRVDEIAWCADAPYGS